MDFCLLSKFDDLLSDIFLDAQFLWFDISKLNSDHRRPRIPSDKVLKIIQDQVLATGKTNEAVKELLRMDYFKHYLAAKSTKQRQEFIQHMKRYMPNAGYEIADTRRYGGAGRRMEACVTVTKDWKTGDELRLCTGMVAHLDPRQEHQVKKGNRDVSLMWSARKQRNCLFLGPARFVNHDCDPNAKFVSRGQNSVTVKIIKDIKCGDELTVFYGKHYFTETSYECRCATCETKRTGFIESEDEGTGLSSTESEEDTVLGRRSKKRKSSSYNDHDLRRKRCSWEIPKVQRIELDELIGVFEDNDDSADMDDGQPGYTDGGFDQRRPCSATESSTAVIEQHTYDDQDEDGDDDNRPRVMSINYLCNENDKKRQQQQQDIYSSSRSPSFSHSPLDLLCNAVLDAEYLTVQPKQEEITIVVSPEIHRDAADRVKRTNEPHYQHHLHQQQKWQFMDEDSSSDTKADSAVGLSPQLQHHDTYHPNQPQSAKQSKIPPSLSANTIERITSTSTKKTAVSKLQWKDSIDSLFDDEQLSELDDFMDDLSDLSSVCSSDLTLDSDLSIANNNISHKNQKHGHPSSRTPLDLRYKQPKSPTGSSNSHEMQTSASTCSSPAIPSAIPNTNKNTTGGKPGLNCMACGRALKSETISDSIAVDVAVANELATWAWSPSVAFIDWRPQRCPRCERHVRVFTQEWPLRKMKKKAPLPGGAKMDLTLPPATKQLSAGKKRSTVKKQQKKPSQINNTEADSCKSSFEQQPPPTPTSEIFSGVENLF